MGGGDRAGPLGRPDVTGQTAWTLSFRRRKGPPDDTGAELATEREVGRLLNDTVTLTPEGDEITTFCEERVTGGTV